MTCNHSDAAVNKGIPSDLKGDAPKRKRKFPSYRASKKTAVGKKRCDRVRETEGIKSDDGCIVDDEFADEVPEPTTWENKQDSGNCREGETSKNDEETRQMKAKLAHKLQTQIEKSAQYL